MVRKGVRRIKAYKRLSNLLAVLLPVIAVIVAMNFIGSSANALVQPNGRLFYGDQTNTVLRFQTNSFDFTFNGEQSFTHGASSSLIAHTVAKVAPTRDEVMIGSLKVDGQLMVIKGVNGYDVNTDFSLAWTNTGTTGAQTCNNVTEVDCTRAFDITYERLSGRAMVVYADTTNQKLYYCYWDGSAWGPQAACTPTDGTNDITLTSNGRPDFVSLKAKGASDEILLGVSIDVAGVHEVETFIWDGSSWGTNNLATDTANAPVNSIEAGQVFDVEWETNSGDALVVWGGITAGTTHYKLKPSGGSWGSTTAGPALVGGNGAVSTMNLDADSNSNRIAFASSDNASDGNLGIWKADGTTPGWTMGNEDTTLETNNPGTQYTDVIWQKNSSTAVWFGETGSTSADTEYQTAVCDGSGCTFSSIDATIATAGSDDGTFVRLAASPNSNDIMVLWSHIDRDIYAQHWDGSAWEGAASASLEADASPGTADNSFFQGMPAAFVYIPYSPWARNWRFYSGTDTTDTPTTALASENTAPTAFNAASGKFRLRYSVAELSGMGQADARKKLQYASGGSCTPDTVEGDTDCTWTDVDDPAGSGIWRYVDCNGGSAVCNDDTALAATVLSGSPTVGWWVLDKDAAGGTNMDQSALQLSELEYPVEANGAAPGTTYYFRIYDVDQDKPVRREQDNDGSNDCVTAACTYPSLTTLGTDQLHYRWRSDDGSETTGSSLAAEDTPLTGVTAPASYRLRLQVNNTGGDAGNIDYRLDWATRVGGACDNDESYAAVPDVATSEPFDMILTSNYTDGSASTNAASGPGVLSNPSGTFTAGKLVESTSNSTGNISMTNAHYTELEYALQVNANAVAGYSYCLRVSNAGTPLTTYTNYVSMQMYIAGPTTDQILRNGSWFSGGAEQSFFWSGFILPVPALRKIRKYFKHSSK